MQRVRSRFRKKPLTQFVLASLCAAGTQVSFAQTSGDLGSVQSTATASAGAAAPSGNVQSAPAQAPSQGSLSASEPKSIISRHYIENSTAPTANYSDIIQISPSVSNIDPNGAGLMESQSLSIRGFQDGQYNVTFDGIPFGDANDFTHHSTSFFSSRNIGSIAVDRGPGDASQIGFATFGGTISVQSVEPSLTPKFTVFGSYGSFNTWTGGAELNTGDMQQWGDARAVVGYNHVGSDGYLTNAAQRRDNFFFKLDKPLGDDTLLTLYADYSRVHQNVSLGATAAQIHQFGPDFGLSGDPTSQSYYGYNFDRINTDFEYIGIKTKLADWKIENKLYTYAYYHDGFNGLDPNGETPNGTTFGPNNVPGQQMANNYRAFGDIVNAERQIGPGKLQLGAWLTHQSNFRDNMNVDDSLNFALEQLNFTMHDTFLTFEPFIQYEWQLPHGLTVTPGVKYVSFNRNIDTPLDQGSGAAVNFSHTWTKVLPSLTLHEQINPNWSAYIQYAQGFLAPNLNVFYVQNPSVSGQPDPEQTDNYQIGTTYKTDRLTVSADLYYINFRNAVTSRVVSGTATFSNAGGAVYKGFESEATFYAGLGFSLYGNLTFNSAKQKNTNTWMPNAPQSTAALGLIYERGPLYGSLITKFVGHQFGDTGDTQPIGGFTVTNLSAVYTIKSPASWMHNTRIGLELDNVFNRTSIDALAGFTAAAGTPLYWTIPGRAVVASLSTDF
ncbi:TonB-dependent receptor [Paraburkholderia elongata]|uniref:TonB-dependent receptor n=1 Tax=Paraburkholderia elongata TaxID=2675747 RepID=A0A972SJ92_9BURK|nr:TonB-dependent receptor [Paraburkholderia elongata]NPT57778.1 TonB-dependent receptor [Paraburkholderia elongata]